MAGNLQRMQMGRAGQELEQAAQRMEDALRRLERGENPEEQQDEALDRLDEARREMEQARREVEEELAREQLAKIADQIKGLRERQDGLTAEGERLQRELLNREDGLWRTLVISLNRLSENQKKLGEETARVAEEKLAGAPVFARVLEHSAQAMERASDHLQKHAKLAFQEKKPETPDGAEAARLQKDALRRLDQLLEALKEATDQPMRGGRGGGGGGDGGDGGGGGGGAPGDGIPPLAQLKLLRQMQAEVNQRTEAFHKQHPDLAKLAPERQAELQAIEREQREVANLLEELLGPANPEGGRS
jgi:DNA repair exonuclease SbcCD ATPase subunit